MHVVIKLVFVHVNFFSPLIMASVKNRQTSVCPSFVQQAKDNKLLQVKVNKQEEESP